MCYIIPRNFKSCGTMLWGSYGRDTGHGIASGKYSPA